MSIKYLRQAKTFKQGIRDQFLIYRYERLLEEVFKSRISLNEVGTINVLNILKYEKYQKLFNELLEQGALLCMQFWTGYLDDMPNMRKSCEVGHRILGVDKRIMKNWEKMQGIYSNSPKDLLSYSVYLRQIWNDEEYAHQIAEKAKESSYLGSHATIFNTDMNDIASFSLDGAACAFISGEKVCSTDNL